MDYRKEAINLKTLHENLKEFNRLIVPLPVEQLTTSRVLTMDYVKGEKITALSSLEKMDIHTEELAELLFQAYVKQIFMDGFFQMDPHPGNVYLTEVNRKTGLVIFDLGMVARMPYQMQSQMIKCLFAIGEGKELEVVKNLLPLGKQLSSFDEYYFRTKITDLIGIYRTASLGEISIGKVVMELARAAAEAGLWLPSQFSTMGKTFLSLEPIMKALNPNFKPQAAMQQYSADLFGEQLARHFTRENFYALLLESSELLQQLPGFARQFSTWQVKIPYDLNSIW